MSKTLYVQVRGGRFRPATRGELDEALLANGERVWWCVPFRWGNMAEPCVAGSTHDRPYECRWVLLVDPPTEEEG